MDSTGKSRHELATVDFIVYSSEEIEMRASGNLQLFSDCRARLGL